MDTVMITYPPPMRIQQNAREFLQLLAIYRACKPKRVLEVGVADGGTLWCWAHNCEPGTRIVAVSRYDEPEFTDPRPMFAQWGREGGCEIVGVDVEREEVPEHLRQFDWAFIDADHHYESYQADWARYSAWAAPGAVIAFHDVAEVVPSERYRKQGKRFWDELSAAHETISIVFNPGLANGIGVVFMP